MNTNMSIRDLTRNGKILTDFDYIDIEDKKASEYKGLFVSKKYADEVKKLIDKKINKEKNRRLSQLLKFVAIANGDTQNKTVQEIIAKKSSKYE